MSCHFPCLVVCPLTDFLKPSVSSISSPPPFLRRPKYYFQGFGTAFSGKAGSPWEWAWLAIKGSDIFIPETVDVPNAAISKVLKQGLDRIFLCHLATGDEASW